MDLPFLLFYRWNFCKSIIYIPRCPSANQRRFACRASITSFRSTSYFFCHKPPRLPYNAIQYLTSSVLQQSLHLTLLIVLQQVYHCAQQQHIPLLVLGQFCNSCFFKCSCSWNKYIIAAFIRLQEPNPFAAYTILIYLYSSVLLIVVCSVSTICRQ